MSMIAGEAIFLEHGTYLDLRLEVTETDVVLVVTEDTAFHREHYRGEVPMFDEDGWLTPRGTGALEGLLREHLGAGVWVDDGGRDIDPYFEVTVLLPGITHESTEDEAFDAAWPHIAELANRLDPGTFGVPYVIDEVRRALNGTPW